MIRLMALTACLTAFAAFADVPFDNTVSNAFWDCRAHVNLPASHVAVAFPAGGVASGRYLCTVQAAEVEIGKTFEWSNVIPFTSFPAPGFMLFAR